MLSTLSKLGVPRYFRACCVALKQVVPPHDAGKTVNQGEKWHHTPAIITSENIADTIASNFIMSLQYSG